MSRSTYNLRTFYTLIVTQTLSLVGSQISGLAVGIHVFNDTGNATPLALVAFFSMLPMVVASGLSGVLADRWDRRLVMALSDAGQAVGTLLLLISFATGSFELWHLYVITLLQAVFRVFQGPAFSASVTLLVPDDHRDRANAIQQLTQPMAGILAPVFAGFIYAAVGVNGAIALDLLTFLAAFVVVLSVSIPRPEETEEGRQFRGTVIKEMLSGFQYLLTRRSLLAVVIYVCFLNFLVGGAMTLGTPYILARTGSETDLGIVLSIMNVGAIVGGVAIGVWGGTRPRMNTIMPSIIFAGVLLAGIGMSQSAMSLAVTTFLFMVPLPVVNALFSSIMQAKVPPDIQGRVFAVLSQLSMLLTPIAALLVGPLADQVFEPAVNASGWQLVAPLVGTTVGSGMGLIMFVGGCLTAVISVLMFSIPAIRNLESSMPDYIPAVTQGNVSPIPGESHPASEPVTA